MLMVVFLGTAGCSDNDINLSDDDLYLDENLGDVWTGDGLPTWLNDRQFKFELEAGWMVESYLYGVLWKAYKFNHKGTLMLALEYEKVGNEYNWSEGTICYAADGREVNFSKVKDSFKKGSELIWTNEICSEGSVPQISYCDFENPETLEWLQKIIDASCREVVEAGNFMLAFHFGYCEYSLDKENNLYLGVEYDYADRVEKKRTTVQKVYTPVGESVNKNYDLPLIYFVGGKLSWCEFLSQLYVGE